MPTDHPTNDHHTGPAIAQAVFVGALLLIVFSVIAEYLLGDFKGLNPGADFGLVIGVALMIAFLVGLVVAVFHHARVRKDR